MKKILFLCTSFMIHNKTFTISSFTIHMRKLFLLLALGLASCAMNAQDLRNSSNSYIGKIESDGTVRNSSNSSVGKIERDGTIRNSSNTSIGKIESDGTIRNGNNSSIGKVESDGTVRKNGSSVGKIEKDGTVRNSSNSCIGYAKGVPVKYAALFFFFDFFKK